MAPEVVLLGNVHTDLCMGRRLPKALREIHPTVIAVEIGPYTLGRIRSGGVSTRERIRALFPEEPGHILDLAEKMASQFEALVLKTHGFGEANNIPVHCVDDHPAIEKLRADEGFKKRCIADIVDAARETGSTVRAQMECDAMYCLFNNLWDEGGCDEFLQECPSKYLLNGRRDSHVAKRIDALLSGSRDDHVVHICGLAHTLDDPKRKRTLYSILAKEGIPVRRAHLLQYG